MSARSGDSVFMTPKRWAVIIGLAFVLLLLLLNLYYQWIQSPLWKDERAVEQRAREEAGLTDIVRTEKSVWDETVWVVEGADAAGRPVYVWVTEERVETVPATGSVPRERVAEAVVARKPDAQIIRIRPALLDGKRAWEAYFSRPGAVERYYYEFYDFADGSFIVEYRLPARSTG